MGSFIMVVAQVDLSDAFSSIGGPRVFTGFTMLVHMFFAQLFVGFALAAPVLEWVGARKGSPRMDRLAHSLTRFNAVTFSTGATFAVLFIVLLVGLYPRLTTSLFTNFFYFLVIAMASMILTFYLMYSYYYKWDRYGVLKKGRHIALGLGMAFFIWLWMFIMTGIDTFMITGGGADTPGITQQGMGDFSTALSGIFNPMFIEMSLHRAIANLSWPALAVACWAAFRYQQAKSEHDRAFYDWTSSAALTWGVGLLLLMPFLGFATAYAMKGVAPEDPVNQQAAGGAYERLMTGETSTLLYINLILVVAMFILAAAAMFLGAVRHPQRRGQMAIRLFGLVAVVAGLYSISPLADFPTFYARYIAMLIMVVATLVALLAYIGGRRQFRYGSPGFSYRAVLMGLGVLAAVVALNMGFMKSNSRVPFTVYNQSDYNVESSPPPTGVGR